MCFRKFQQDPWQHLDFESIFLTLSWWPVKTEIAKNMQSQIYMCANWVPLKLRSLQWTMLPNVLAWLWDAIYTTWICLCSLGMVMMAHHWLRWNPGRFFFRATWLGAELFGHSLNLICVFCFGVSNQINWVPSPKYDLEAQILLDEGFLDVLVDLSKLGDYWAHMLQEYPDHPAAANPMGSIPIMLYGHLPLPSIKFYHM